MDRKLLRGRRNWSKGKRWIRIFLFALFVVWAIDSLIIGDYGLFQIFLLKREEVRIHREILALQARREILERERRLLKEDLFTIERIAREQYGMLKPGEKKVLFLSEKNE